MNRKGLSRWFAGKGMVIVAVFLAVFLIYMGFLQDLSTTTDVKSSAAYERIGVTEEVLNAECATAARNIFTYESVVNGDLSCINSGRAIALRFEVEKDGGTEVYRYSISGSLSGTEVEELPEGEGLTQYAEEPRTYSIVVEDGEKMYRGTVEVAITGGGWRCEAARGRCIEEGEACGGSTYDLDCGEGRTCCTGTQTVT